MSFTVLCEEIGGSTRRCLLRLRNALADYHLDELCVLEIPTQPDGMLVGFLVLNRTQRIALWTGDGFRTDEAGEGGAGYSTAILLLKQIWGLTVPAWEILSMQPVLDGTVSLEQHLRGYIKEFDLLDGGNTQFNVPYIQWPGYLRMGSV
jgi:hypothetical protein